MTDPFGDFLALLTTPDQQSVEFAHDGYGAFPTSALSMTNDRNVSFYLPPLDDSLTNGGFENAAFPLEGWVSTGSYTTTLVVGQSGLHAAQLGYPCLVPCLSPAENPHPAQLGFPVLAMDSMKNTHMLWSYQMYSVRDAHGNWSAPVNLLQNQMEIPANPESGEKGVLVVDSGNTVHAVMGDGNLYYAQKPPGGSWTDPVMVTYGYHPALAVDRQGSVYMTYSYAGDSTGVYFQKRLPSGIWQERVMLGRIFARAISDVVVGPDSTIHFVFDSDNRLKYRSLSSEGTLSNWEYITPDLINSQVRPSSPRLKVDASGGLHVVYQREDNHQAYLYRPARGTGRLRRCCLAKCGPGIWM